MAKTKVKLSITLLSTYVMTWALVFIVPLLGFNVEKSDRYTSYLLFAEEVLLLLCIVVIGIEFAKDMRNKLSGKRKDE